MNLSKLWTRKPSRAEVDALTVVMMDEKLPLLQRQSAARVLAFHDRIPPYLEDAAAGLTPLEGQPTKPPEGFEKTAEGKVERKRKAISKCLADIAPEEYEWLWPGRIPKGTCTLIAGDGGAGKSTLTGVLATAVTAGKCWPDEPDVPVETGQVVILTAEESASTDIRPRIDRFGGDPRRIHILEAIDAGEGVTQRFSFARDEPQLRELCEELGNVQLIIVDPIAAYMGNIDTHNDAQVQQGLQPLFDLAADLGIAVVLIIHLNKSAASSIEQRIQAAAAFRNKCRMTWFYSADPRDRSKRVLSWVKGNPEDHKTTALGVGRMPNGILAWDPKPIDLIADQIVYQLAQQQARGEVGPKGGRPPDQVQKAVEFITERLSFEPSDRAELERDARRDERISRTTFLRALKRMNGAVSQFVPEGGKPMLRLEPKLGLHGEPETPQ